jgi:hypothetical protein
MCMSIYISTVFLKKRTEYDYIVTSHDASMRRPPWSPLLKRLEIRGPKKTTITTANERPNVQPKTSSQVKLTCILLHHQTS